MTTSVDSRPSFDVRSPAATAAGWTGERGLPAALDPRGPRRCRPHRPARQPSSRCAPRRLFGAARVRGAEGRAFARGESGSGRVSSCHFFDIGLGRHLGRRSRAKLTPGFPLRHAYSNDDILDAVKLLPKRLYPLETDGRSSRLRRSWGVSGGLERRSQVAWWSDSWEFDQI